MKSKLTLEESIEKKFTPTDCVKYYFPKATNERAGFILWERTNFPFGMEQTLEQLYREYKSIKELGV